jgi:hypothetical protein
MKDIMAASHRSYNQPPIHHRHLIHHRYPIRNRRACRLFKRLALAGLAMLIVAPLAERSLADDAPTAQPAASQPIDTTLQTQFDGQGLAALNVGAKSILANRQVGLRDLRYPDGAADHGEFDVKSSMFDAGGHALTMTYSWGNVRITYGNEPNQMRLSVAVDNTGSRPIAHFAYCLMSVQFPEAPQGVDWQNRFPIYHDRADNFPILIADWKTAKLALCTDELDQKAIFGYQPMPGDPYEVMVKFEDDPIQPGATRTATVFFRSAGADKPGWTMMTDLLHAYALKFPSEMHWTDHRPIGSAFLSTSVAGYPHNPRGWLLDPAIDTDTEAGRIAFKDKMLTYADQSVQHCKELDAQGVIVWDVEGQQMPHATSYLADPRMLSKVAPEMDAIADEFFSRFTKAGLRTGITVRPSRVVADPKPMADGRQGWMQQDVPDVVAEMDDKINYARQRWGCTIFYCDSNVTYVRDETGRVLSDPPITVDTFAALARRHPDCLFIPEHKTDRYWAYTAPYSEYRLGINGTPPQVRIAYPDAFSVLRLVDGPDLSTKDSIAALVPNLAAGDVPLFRPWWADPQTDDIAHLYGLAHPH